MSEYSVVVVSHSKNIAQGIYDLTQEVAKEVDLKCIGGIEDGEIGTSFETINETIDSTEHKNVLAFYDLGSAKMNLDMAKDFSDKSIEIFDVPVVEGVYTACALLQSQADIEVIKEQLNEMKIKK